MRTKQNVVITLLLPIVALLSMTGCKTESTVGVILQPSFRTTVTVEGMNPFIGVRNNGPGEVTVLFTPNVGLPEGPTPLINGLNARTMRGGGNVQIANTSSDRAEVHVSVQYHTHMSIKQEPIPAPEKSP